MYETQYTPDAVTGRSDKDDPLAAERLNGQQHLLVNWEIRVRPGGEWLNTDET